jgi:hypothetical protein
MSHHSTQHVSSGDVKNYPEVIVIEDDDDLATELEEYLENDVEMKDDLRSPVSSRLNSPSGFHFGFDREEGQKHIPVQQESKVEYTAKYLAGPRFVVDLTGESESPSDHLAGAPKKKTDNEHTCEICSSQFPNSGTLEWHIVRKHAAHSLHQNSNTVHSHSARVTKKGKSQSQMERKCAMCGESDFPTRWSLIFHYKKKHPDWK